MAPTTVKTGPSAHLFWSELACNDGTAYPTAWRTDPTRAVALATVFERLRAECGEPLLVLSAYRTPTYNAVVGGTRFSQHLEGRALDLVPSRGAVTVDALWNIARGLARVEPLLKGLGRYDRFVHIDVRPTRRLAVWDMRRPEGGMNALDSRTPERARTIRREVPPATR